MITIRMSASCFDELLKRIRKKRPNDVLETRRVGDSFKEVVTSLSEDEAKTMCQGLRQAFIKEV